MVSDDLDVVKPIDLHTLELENFEAEIRDHVVIEIEKMKLKEDQHCWIHDQKLARQIFHMPERQWKEADHNFERTYLKGSSSKRKDN